ncbi:hypothetical protein [Thioalkalivibrio thiocyanodenitrificans]|uniref:hypothetical protein n=1 Tax=Thioalkalivibrio thiocyanodenitrificans TaxID=243063 RepID=UPI000475BBDB|nr:hypothetical protein [Thioalkalivibrio thiocyanodenitrificans]
MRRLYFLAPDVDSTRRIVDDLLLHHVEERHIHVVASDEKAVTDADLPEAGLLQESDFIPAVERGLALGGATGALAGLAAMVLPGVGLAFGGGAILGTTLAGAGVGAWASSMIGLSAPSSRLRAFEEAIRDGQVLVIVDVPKRSEQPVIDLIISHHPEARVEGTEATVPAFP